MIERLGAFGRARILVCSATLRGYVNPVPVAAEERLSGGDVERWNDRAREDRRTVPTDEGDHERFSHFVEKDKLTEAMVMGTPVVALCGKVWVPSRAPEKFPVCPECKEIWDSMKSGDKPGGGSGSDGSGPEA